MHLRDGVGLGVRERLELGATVVDRPLVVAAEWDAVAEVLGEAHLDEAEPEVQLGDVGDLLRFVLFLGGDRVADEPAGLGDPGIVARDIVWAHRALIDVVLGVLEVRVPKLVCQQP